MDRELRRTPRRILRDRLEAATRSDWSVTEASNGAIVACCHGWCSPPMTPVEAEAAAKALPMSCIVGEAHDVMDLFACALRSRS